MESLKKLRTLPVSSLMRREVPMVQGSQTVEEAINVMKEHHVSGLVVKPRNSDDTFGIITEKDIIEKVIDPGEDVHKDPWNTPVHTVMSKPCVTVHPEMQIKYAIRLMHNVGIRRLLVLKDNELVGVLSQSEILHAVEDLEGSEHVAL